MAASISKSCFLSKAIDFRGISECLIFVQIVCDSLNQMDAGTQFVMYPLVTVNFRHVYCTVDACVEHSLFVFRITQIELSVCSRDTHVWKRKKQSRLFFFSSSKDHFNNGLLCTVVLILKLVLWLSPMFVSQNLA